MDVWSTRGAKFHSRSDCSGIRDGQAKAASQGKRTYPPQVGVLLDSAKYTRATELESCMVCWPDEQGWSEWLRVDLEVDAHAGTPSGSVYESYFYWNVLKLVPGLSPSHVKVQPPVGTRGNVWKPDFVIDMPGHRQIVIEIDGKNKSDQARENDRERTLERDAELEKAGYRVQHFTNKQVRKTPEWCLEQVSRLLVEERERKSPLSEDRATHTLPPRTDPLRPTLQVAFVAPPQAPALPPKPPSAVPTGPEHIWLMRPGTAVAALIACIFLGVIAFNAYSGGDSRGGGASGPCGADFPVRGNVSQSGDRIYHLPGWRYYDLTDAEACFSTSSDAEDAGFRPSQVQ